MRLFRKSIKIYHVEILLGEYLEIMSQCCETFKHSMDEYLSEHALTDEFHRLQQLTHRFESEGDDKRRKIEVLMYSKGLIPQTRGDILGLIESMDKIPNSLEMVLQKIYLEKIKITKIYHDRLKELVDINVEAFKAAIRLFKAFIDRQDGMNEYIEKIDQLESQSDYLEQKLIHDFFRSKDLSDFQRIVYRDLIMSCGSVADRAENFSDRVRIYSVKRVF